MCCYGILTRRRLLNNFYRSKTFETKVKKKVVFVRRGKAFDNAECRLTRMAVDLLECVPTHIIMTEMK